MGSALRRYDAARKARPAYVRRVDVLAASAFSLREHIKFLEAARDDSRCKYLVRCPGIGRGEQITELWLFVV